MAEPKKSSLTVLGGPMAGTRFLVPEGPASLLLGSDDSCHFQLALPGVSPEHARISVHASGAMIHATGSPLYVNDNPVHDATPLYNGDIVWLGTPGDADVVMLQCILPPRAAIPPEASAVEETLAIAPESGPQFAALDEGEYVLEEAPDAAPTSSPPEPGSFEAEAVQAMFEESAPEPEPVSFIEPGAPAAEAEPELVVEAAPEPTETLAEAPSPTVILGGEQVEESFFVEESPPPPDETLLLSQAERVPPSAPEPAPPPPPPAPPPPAVAPAPPPAPPAPAVPRPPAPAVAPKSAAPVPTPRPPRPSTPAAPAPTPRKREAPAVPRPQPAVEGAEAVPPRTKASSRTGLYAALGLGVLVVGGVGAFGAWRLLSKPKAAPSPAAFTEAELAQAVATPTAAPPPSTPEPVVTPTPVEAASPPPPAVPALKPTPPVTATPAPPTPRPIASAAATPSPKVSPRQAAPTPPPTPSAEVLRAQQTAAQVASLLAQADSALAARQYDAAIGSLDAALKLDPQNAKAVADKASAVSLRDAARKGFVPGRTIVKTEKASGGLAGFEGADVQKAAVQGRIDFEISPPSGIRPGDTYNLKFYLVNEGKKAIRVAGITATTVVNGTGSGSAVAPRVKEVEPQQRAFLGELSGLWKEGTTAWSTEILVAANKDDSLKNTLTWR